MTFEFYDRPSWFGKIRVRRADDPDFDQMRPRRRVRGRRRYYRTLRREAETFSVRPMGQYDYMHWHVDWSGLGNLRWRERREHLAALFTMFRRLLAETSEWSTPHQAWLQIDAYDGSQDAVYLHTANPNAENFPNPFAGVDWNAPIPDRLREFMTEPSWEFGRIDHYWTHFVVRPRLASQLSAPRP
jgi:hypothetical protein